MEGRLQSQLGILAQWRSRPYSDDAMSPRCVSSGAIPEGKFRGKASRIGQAAFRQRPLGHTKRSENWLIEP